jgi:hypothetical protein
MATYTQLDQQEIQPLADYYQLTVAEFEPLDVGNSNSSHLINDP